MAATACPNCGSKSINAWYRESVRYNGHFTVNDDGELDFQFDMAGQIGEDDGDLEEYVCYACTTILKIVEGDQLVAAGNY